MSKLQLPLVIGGAYTLREEIGRGGMAAVYLADLDLAHFDWNQLIARQDLSRADSRRLVRESSQTVELRSVDDYLQVCAARGVRCPQPGEQVAVKILLDTGPQQGRFRDEWLSLIALDHPNLIRVYGGGEDRTLERCYYAMERVAAPLSLEEIAAAPIDTAIEIVRQAARGLRALHRSGLVHRDIKPANILATREGGELRVVVTDLGVAKDIERSLELTQTGSVIGTPSFMAPELIRCAKVATPAADVYALGATLYNYATGVLPYEGGGLYSVLSMVINGEAPLAPRRIRPEIPARVERLIHRMMAMAPEERIPDMESLLDELDRLEASDATVQTAATLAVSGVRLPEVTRAPRCRVLVVDGDDRSRELLARFLERARYLVDVAADGAQALLRMGAHDIDLLIAAEKLPVLDGPALLQTLRAQGHDLPVLLLSDGPPQTSEQLLDSGIVELVTRPVSLPALVMKLEHIRVLLD